MTIHELAKELNVSAATVSLALKGDTRVAESTRQRILEYADKRGYRANEQARNLRLGRSGLVALMVANIASDFWSGAVKAIEDVLGDSYSVIVCNSDGNLEKEKKLVENLAARRIDGLIVQPADNEQLSHLAELEKAGTPVVFLERNNRPELSFAKGDDFEAGRKAVRIMRDAGHTAICAVSVRKNLHTGTDDRISGIKSAIEECECIDSCKLIDVDKIEELDAKSISKYTAVICTDDRMILSVLRLIEKNGMKCPDDVSVLCWNNKNYLNYLHPAISCFSIPVTEIGRLAADHITKYHDGDKAPLRIFTEEPVIMRNSIKKRTR